MVSLATTAEISKVDNCRMVSYRRVAVLHRLRHRGITPWEFIRVISPARAALGLIPTSIKSYVALDLARVSLVNVAAYGLAAPVQEFSHLSTSRLWLHPLSLPCCVHIYCAFRSCFY